MAPIIRGVIIDKGQARVWKCLDRVLLNLKALQMDSSFLVQHLARDPSDHSPLLMIASSRLDHKPKPFRFLNVWTTKAGLLDVIRDAWSGERGGAPLGILASKLRAVKHALKGGLGSLLGTSSRLLNRRRWQYGRQKWPRSRTLPTLCNAT